MKKVLLVISPVLVVHKALCPVCFDCMAETCKKIYILAGVAELSYQTGFISIKR